MKCNPKCYTGEHKCDMKYCKKNYNNLIKKLIKQNKLPSKGYFKNGECKEYKHFVKTQAIPKIIPKWGTCFENKNCKNNKCVAVLDKDLRKREMHFKGKKFLKYCNPYGEWQYNLLSRR